MPAATTATSGVPQKICRKCGQSFDMTPDNFFRSSASPDGYATKCKRCYTAPPETTRGPRPDQRRKRSTGTVVTESGYVASRELLQVWEAVLASRDQAGHSPMMFFYGPSGSGKTAGAEYLAKVAGMPFTKVDAPSMTDPESWFGTREIIAKDGVPVTVYRPSGFIEAIQRAGVLLVDEANRIADANRGILLPLFDGTHQVTNPLTGETVHKHPECIVILSGNVGLQFTGTYAIDPAFTTRSLNIPFSYLAADDEARVVIDRTGCDEQTAKVFVRFANETRQRAGTTDPDMNPVSTREVIAAADLVARGLPIDVAAAVAIINGASDEGGVGGVKDRLVNIWQGIRPAR